LFLKVLRENIITVVFMINELMHNLAEGSKNPRVGIKLIGEIWRLLWLTLGTTRKVNKY